MRLKWKDRSDATVCWLVVCAVSALCASQYADAAQNDNPRKPNIIILFADDLGYGDTSLYGGDIPTPRISALAEGGVLFTDGYVTAPVCNPSRAGLLSGRYQQRFGQTLNSQTEPPIGSTQGSLPRSQTTIASALKNVGYATGAIGKWQLGMADGQHPLDRGYDYFTGMASGMDFVDPSWPDVHIVEAPDDSGLRCSERSTGSPRSRSDPPRRLFQGRDPVELNEYLTDRLARESVEFIDRHKDEPFFLYVAHYAVHVPLETTDKYYQRFPGVDNETKRVYAAMASALDDAVGDVMDKLEAEGLLENTLVFFLSDNGAAQYIDADGKRNAPLTGHKRNLYEGGIRIPFAVQWKGRIPEGQTTSHPVSSLDIYPTALGAAGVQDVDSYGLDGVNLLRWLEDVEEDAPHDYLYWRSGPNAAVRKGNWKLLKGGDDVVRLYDLSNDMAESRDLSARHPEIVNDLQAALERWNREMAPPREASRRVTTDCNGDVIEWHI